MDKNWRLKIKEGAMPTDLIKQEFDITKEFESFDVIFMFNREFPGVDNDIFYAIWNWDKPYALRRRLSDEKTNEWILKLINHWEKEQQAKTDG